MSKGAMLSHKNVISNGLVLDKNGQKMSKRLGNAVDPFETLGSALSFKLSKDLACDENQEGFSQDYLFQELKHC